MSLLSDETRKSEGRLGVFLLAGDPDEHGQSKVDKAGRDAAGVYLFVLDFSADHLSTTRQLDTTAGDVEGLFLSTDQVRDVGEREKGHYEAIMSADNTEEILKAIKVSIV